MVNRKDELKGTIIAAFVADEEYLSRGTHRLLADGLKADMAIMAECRFDEMAVGFRGRYSIGIDVSGETAHASKYPHAGESAIINAARLAQGIEELPTKIHSHLGAGTWCIRHIAGGVKNTLNVPDKCNLFVDRYVVPGESFEICKEQIEDLAKELGLEDKISVELVPRGETPYMESFSIPEDHILVTTISEKFKDIVGKELAIGYDPSVCDSNYLYQLGNIPTVTFGPSGKHLHAPNEFGYMDQVKYSAQIYLKTLEELLF